MICTYEDINTFSNITSDDISNTDVAKIIAGATKELNGLINIKVSREPIMHIDSTRENAVDSTNDTFYVQKWEKSFADMNNDGIITPDDIKVYQVDSDGVETRLPVKTIAGCSSYQKWGFTATKTINSPTGLTNDTTAYTASISVDGVANAISVVGSAAQTMSTLIDEINSDLTNATASWDTTSYGFIKITSDASGDQVSSSSIAITDVDLFATLTSVEATVETAVTGVSNSDYPGQFVLETAPTNGYRLFVTYEWCYRDISGPDEKVKMACIFLSIAYCYAKMNIGRAPTFSVGNKKIYRDMDSFEKYYQMSMKLVEEINYDMSKVSEASNQI